MAVESDGRQARDAARWMAQARHDLDSAEFSAQGGRHALACFLCHQAAEKAVTAFLLSRGAEQVWGHALADLCEDAMNFDPSFDFVKSAAVLLDKHYLGARYPSGLPGGTPAEVYDDADSAHAIGIAQEVVSAVQKRIQDGANT